MTLRYTVPLTDGDSRELVAARLWLLGATGVQELTDALVGWFDHRVEDVPPGGSWETEPQRDWLTSWREGIDTVRAGRVAVVPSWLADEHDPAPDEVTIALDPGAAFGSGHHATTRLCLEALQRHLRPRAGASVLDVGCGTGVLAIAAGLLGAGRVEALDVDPDAVAATRANADANGVAVSARVGSVDRTVAPADVVVANLLTPTLHALAAQLVAATRVDGVLVVSGVADERGDGVLASLCAAGARPVEREHRDGWAMLAVRPTGPPQPAVGP